MHLRIPFHGTHYQAAHKTIIPKRETMPCPVQSCFDRAFTRSLLGFRDTHSLLQDFVNIPCARLTLILARKK